MKPPRLWLCRLLLSSAILAFCPCAGNAGPKKFVPQDFADAERLNDLLKKKQDAEAAPLLESIVRRHEQVLGRDADETIGFVALLAAVHRDLGSTDKAIALFEGALQAYDRVHGKDDARAKAVLQNLGRLHFQTRSYARAVILYRRLLGLHRRYPDDDSSDQMLTENNLAVTLSELGKHSEAMPFFERVLRNDRKRAPESAETATSALQLAKCYRELGKTDEAEQVFQEAIRIRTKLFGKESAEVKDALGESMLMYSRRGDTKRALELVGALTDGDAQLPEKETLETAKTLNNQAAVFLRAGDYAKADPLLERALGIVERLQGKDHPDTAALLGNIASLKEKLGYDDEAQALFERALVIKEKAFGVHHPEFAAGLNNLGTSYLEQGQIEKGKACIARALAIYEKAYGKQHDTVVQCLNNLANAYDRNGEPVKAKALYLRGLAASEAAHGKDHASSGGILNNLGMMNVRSGDASAAVPFLRRALGIYERSLGDAHPTTAGLIENLAVAEFVAGHKAEFLILVKRAEEAYKSTFANVLSFASEEERLSWQRDKSPLTLFALAGNPDDFARCVLRYKGIVLDSILEDRAVAAANPGASSSLEALRQAKQTVWQATLLAGASSSAEDRQQLEVASAKVRDAEKELTGGFAGLGRTRRALEINVADVQAALPPATALIEVTRYLHYLGKEEGELRYAAVILSNDAKPRLVLLGAADPLDKLVHLFKKSVRGGTDSDTERTSIQKLYEQVWSPLQRELPNGTQRAIVSPDGQLSFVPFAALADSDGKFVCEKYQISYAASGRDLLAEAKGSAHGAAVIFGNPAFAVNAPIGDSATRSTAAEDLRALSFLPLPGAARETEALAVRCKAAGLQTTAFNAASATELQVRGLQSPRVLHLATHGFFVEGAARDPKKAPATVNSMQRSGLALAGAQSTLEAWRAGRIPPTENDGILTAEEISTLKLNGTWLVTLSACDTGSGEVRFGEGVLGLRRGFIQAGAQHLLMTLWPISDETTADMMLDFYTRAFATGNAPIALAETQRDWLVKLRDQRGLPAAVRLAGPFIMSSQGTP